LTVGFSGSVDQSLPGDVEHGTLSGMGRLATLRHTFAYDAWANRRLLEVFADLPLQHEILSTWSHLLLSQRLWLERILNEVHSPLALWTVLSVPESVELVHELERRWAHLLEDLPEKDLDREVHFTDTKGKSQTDRLSDILQHVTHHAAYHRGQLTVRLVAAGFTPPASDIMLWSRSQLNN
jgi:uncharacterized damage-inducible protein DinB